MSAMAARWLECEIMFRPNSGFKGKALVRYSVTAPKMPDTYIVSRTIAVR